jgi:hypothetical protein
MVRFNPTPQDLQTLPMVIQALFSNTTGIQNSSTWLPGTLFQYHWLFQHRLWHFCPLR